MGKYRLGLFFKILFFLKKDKFSQEVEDGEFILEQIKKSNRFDYKGAFMINILNLETYQRVIHKEM